MATRTKTHKEKQPESAPALLNVAFILDMSGSMGSIRDAAREGTSTYLSDLQKEERSLVRKHGKGTYTRLSVTAFDTAFENWIINMPIASVDVPALIQRYQPRGWTALYDAIANTITRLESSKEGEDERFLVVVMTDGQENSSVEYGGENGRRRLFDLVKAYEAKGNWTFVYLGANVDAYAEAASIGIPTGNTAYYSSTPMSAAAIMGSTSGVTSSLRGGQKMSSNTAFSDAGLSQDYRDDEEK